MWRMSSKGVRRAENLTRGPPRVWQGQEAVTTLRDGGQRDEGMLSEPRSQGCQAGVGSERGHSLCWKCCPSEGWGRHPGSSLPPMFSPPTGASHPYICSVIQLCPTLHDPMTVACQGPLSMEFPRQEYWSGLPCPPPGDLPDSGSLSSPALAGGLFTTEPHAAFHPAGSQLTRELICRGWSPKTQSGQEGRAKTGSKSNQPQPQSRPRQECTLYAQSPLESLHRVQFSSVVQSCPTLCYPMDCSTPGFPVHHQLPELAQIHVHQVGDAIQPSHPLSSLLLLPPVPPSSRVFSKKSVLLIRWPFSPSLLELQLQHQSFQ